ncbi:MAG TPA: hypothetical protein VHC41_05360, partial [Mycobacteriales bacterium]|nr:hypothetical protein [Mycobacteriales bacterium]
IESQRQVEQHINADSLQDARRILVALEKQGTPPGTPPPSPTSTPTPSTSGTPTVSGTATPGTRPSP